MYKIKKKLYYCSFLNYLCIYAKTKYYEPMDNCFTIQEKLSIFKCWIIWQKKREKNIKQF